jgi:hypothetical protein
MSERIVDLMSYTGGLASVAHTGEDVDQTVLLGQGLLERR